MRDIPLRSISGIPDGVVVIMASDGIPRNGDVIMIAGIAKTRLEWRREVRRALESDAAQTVLREVQERQGSAGHVQDVSRGDQEDPHGLEEGGC